MMYYDTHMCLDISQETVCTTVKVVTGDHMVARFEQTRDHVEGCHSRRYSEGMLSRVYFCEMVFCGGGTVSVCGRK